MVQPLNQPLNYTLNVPNPAEAVTSGLQQGVQLASMMERADALAAQKQQTLLENQALQVKAQREAAQRAALDAFYKKPATERTAADYEAISATLPKEMAENVRASFEAKTKEEQRQDLLFGSQVLSALRLKDTGTASQMLQERAKAYESSGMKAQAQAMQNLADMTLIDPERAEIALGPTIAVVPGGKDFIDNLGKQSQQRREEALFKPELAKKEAEAEIEAIKRDFFSEGERARIDLLKAQAGAQRAAAYKSSREASQVGKLTTEKRFEFEEKLRERYEKNSKDFREISNAFTSIKGTGGVDASPVNRVAKVFAFVKMIDPGSVVREGDFEALRNTRGFALSPDWFKQEVDRVATGAPIKDETVRQINAAATDLYKSSRARDTATREEIDSVAKEYGLDRRNLFISRQEKTEDEERAAKAPQPGPTMTPAQPRATQAAPAMTPATGGGGWSIVSVTKGK